MATNNQSPSPPPSSSMEGSDGQATTAVRQPLNVKALVQWLLQQKEVVSVLRKKLLDPHYNNNNFLADNKNNDVSLEESCLNIRQFGFGQSNPTYLVEVHQGTKEQNNNVKKIQWVLRQKPRKVVHPSAHALHREFRILQALTAHNNSLKQQQQQLQLQQQQQQRQHQGRRQPSLVIKQVPVPAPLVYCRDETVLGAEFYLMEYIPGRIFIDPSLPGMTGGGGGEERRRAYKDAVQIMANLHSLSYKKIGLDGYGKESHFCERQLKRLMQVSQHQAKLLGDENNNNNNNTEELEEIASLLSRAAPHCPDYQALIHGDYKMDNLVFSMDEPKVIGVLDWELSTLGDPLCDLANLSLMYHMPGIEAGLGVAGLMGKEDVEGVPSPIELIEMYCQANKSIPLDTAIQWRGFYLAFLVFKNCVIVQGVAQRAKAGVASSAKAKKVATLLPIMIDLAKDILQKHPPPVANSRL